MSFIFPLSSYIKSEVSFEIALFAVTVLCCYYMPTYVSQMLSVCRLSIVKLFNMLRPIKNNATNEITVTPEHYIVNQIKERGNHLSWYQSMLYPKAILELWQRHSEADNLGADLETFSVLVNAAIRLDRSKYCMQLLEQMNRLGIKRTKQFFESTIRQLASKRHFRNALEVLQMMEGEMPEKIEPTSFACAINFCAQIGDAHHGIRYFSMLEKLETPSLRAYMVVLRLLSKVSDWRLTLGIVQSIKEKGIQVDSFVLNQALSTLVNAEQLDSVREILSDKAFASIRNLISYNLYLKALTRIPTLENYAIGMQFLNDMTKGNLQPNHITYNTMMDFAVKSRKSEETWNIIGRMMLAGVKPDEYTISILVRSLSLHADKEKLETVADLIIGIEKFNPQKINLEHIISAMIEHTNRLEDCSYVRQRLIEYAKRKNLRVRGRMYYPNYPGPGAS